MLAKRGEWNDVEGMLIGGGEHHVAGGAVQVRSKPVGSGHAPAVPGVQPGEAIPRQRGAQIVADALLMLEELRGYDGADRVTAAVLGAGAAAPVAIEAGERFSPARLELAA